MAASIQHRSNTFTPSPAGRVAGQPAALRSRLVLRDAVFPDAIKGVGNTFPARAFAAKFKMSKRNGKIARHLVGAHAEVAGLPPSARRQTNIGPVSIRQKRAVVTWMPAEKVKQAHGITGCSGRKVAKLFWVAPSGAAALVVMQYRARALVDFHFAEIGCGFRPVHIPLRTRAQISFVRAIPGFDTHFDEQQPGERSENEKAR